MRVLVIGAGAIAPRHLQHLQTVTGVVLAGVCDQDAHRAIALAAHWPIPVPTFVCFTQALDQSAPDYVVLLTPRQVREAVIRACVERAIPILMEKPPCHDLASGQRIQALLANSQLLHGVGFMHRWNPAVDECRRLLTARSIRQLSVRYGSPQACRPVDPNQPGPYSVSVSGGLIGDQGIHYLDLARYLCASEATEILALTAQQVLEPDQADSPDSAGWVLRMGSGALVVHSHSWCGPSWWCRVEVVADGSCLDLDLFAGRLTGTVDGRPVHFQGSDNEFALQHQGFSAAIAHADQSRVRCSYGDALASFALAEAVQGAAR